MKKGRVKQNRKIIKAICFGMMLMMLLPGLGFANSAPMLMEEAPGFSIAPMGSTPVSVISEDLEFDMSKEQGDTAKVKASYEMRNTSAGPVKQLMLFPFVTSHTEGFVHSVKVTADDKPVEFKVFRLQDIPYVRSNMKLNYKYNANQELAKTLAIDNVIKMLNQRDDTPQNYNLSRIVKVYTLQLPEKEEPYRAEVAFKINPDKHKLLCYHYTGISLNKDGSGTLTTWAAAKGAQTDRDNAYMVVLGENSKAEAVFKSRTGQNITVEQKTLAEFFKNDVIQKSIFEYEIEDAETLNEYVIKQLDVMMGGNEKFLSIDDIIALFKHSTYVGAFLYTVNFEAESSRNVTVEYEMQATIDRRQTKDYTNMFLYLLRPAAGWREFGGLSIKVIPNESKPFVIESSLPLNKNAETGIYSGQFDSLPEKDFYFVTYDTEKPEPSLSATVSNISKMLSDTLVLVYIIAFMGITAFTVWRIIAKRKQDGK